MDFIAFVTAAGLLLSCGAVSTFMALRAAYPCLRWWLAAAAFWAAAGAWGAAAWRQPAIDVDGFQPDAGLPFAALAYLFTLCGVIAFAWAAWGWRVHAIAARRSVA